MMLLRSVKHSIWRGRKLCVLDHFPITGWGFSPAARTATRKPTRHQAPACARCHTGGFFYKFCLLAEGQADLYPRHGRTMEWDTAAGHAILNAAGGIVTCEDGSRLNMASWNAL